MFIHQEVTFQARPQDVYALLLTSEKFSDMSGGAPAGISPEVGGAVSLFGGQIEARNLELVEGTRIVQSWRAGNWPEGVHSVVRFELVSDGDKTKIFFDQAGFPEGAEEHLEPGWHKMYWDPMKAMFVK